MDHPVLVLDSDLQDHQVDSPVLRRSMLTTVPELLVLLMDQCPTLRPVPVTMVPASVPFTDQALCPVSRRSIRTTVTMASATATRIKISAPRTAITSSSHDSREGIRITITATEEQVVRNPVPISDHSQDTRIPMNSITAVIKMVTTTIATTTTTDQGHNKDQAEDQVLVQDQKISRSMLQITTPIIRIQVQDRTTNTT